MHRIGVVFLPGLDEKKIEKYFHKKLNSTALSLIILNK